jgi:hypothetical protein
MKTNLFLGVVFCSFLYMTNVFAKDCGIEVINSFWADSIKEKEPVGKYKDGEPVHKTQLYLWTKIKGDKAALDCLEQNKQLPIVHKWFCRRIAVGDYDTDPLTPTDKIELTVGNKAMVNKLKLEVDNSDDGSFDWRTWSKKEKLGNFDHCDVIIQYRTGECVKDSKKQDCMKEPYTVTFSD